MPSEAELLEMIKTKQFLVLFLMLYCSILQGLFFTSVYKTYWFTVPTAPSENFAAAFGSIGSVFNGLRFVWSAVLDKVRFKYVYGTLIVLQIFIAFSVNFVVQYKWVYGLWICL